MEVAHISVWRRDPARFWGFYGQRFAVLDGKQPNGAHRALVELERRGAAGRRDHPEHRRAARRRGHADPIEVHGSVATRVLPGLRRLVSRSQRCASGSTPTRRGSRAATAASRSSRTWCCSASCCRRPTIQRGYELAARADLLLCVGSSLEVWPVAELPRSPSTPAARSGSSRSAPTPYDHRAAVKLSGDVVAELEAVVAAFYVRGMSYIAARGARGRRSCWEEPSAEAAEEIGGGAGALALGRERLTSCSTRGRPTGSRALPRPFQRRVRACAGAPTRASRSTTGSGGPPAGAPPADARRRAAARAGRGRRGRGGRGRGPAALRAAGLDEARRGRRPRAARRPGRGPRGPRRRSRSARTRFLRTPRALALRRLRGVEPGGLGGLALGTRRRRARPAARAGGRGRSRWAAMSACSACSRSPSFSSARSSREASLRAARSTAPAGAAPRVAPRGRAAPRPPRPPGAARGTARSRRAGAARRRRPWSA